MDDQMDREISERQYVIDRPNLFSAALIERAKDFSDDGFWAAYTHEVKLMNEGRGPLGTDDPPDLVA